MEWKFTLYRYVLLCKNILVNNFQVCEISKSYSVAYIVFVISKILCEVKWRKFDGVINKAKESCKHSGISELEHFVDADKVVQIGSGATRKQRDYKLSRYACYLITKNSGTMLEELPIPKKSLKQLEKGNKKSLFRVK